MQGCQALVSDAGVGAYLRPVLRRSPGFVREGGQAVEAAVGFEVAEAELDVLGVGQDGFDEGEQEAIVRRKVLVERAAGGVADGSLGGLAKVFQDADKVVPGDGSAQAGEGVSQADDLGEVLQVFLTLLRPAAQRQREISAD